MNNKKAPSNRRKTATVALVVCFVAAIALAGTYTFRQYRDGVKQELELAKIENEKMLEKQKKQEEERTKSANSAKIENQKQEEQTEEKTPEEKIAEQHTQSAPTNVQPKEVTFSAESRLLWPISGDIVMNYSMDKTVYFATLDQYKYNPAVLIAGKSGEQVVAAASGIVKSVETSAETGITVTMDIGGGYEAVYGQLKEVSLEAGVYVNGGAAVGVLSEPTKYYSVEGCNLYFQLLKDSMPVNPLEHLDV